jgi:large conductance mechanosensitive channel
MKSSLPFNKIPVKGFIDFIREQGIVGLAVGFILGGSVSKVVSAIVTDLINPLLGLAFGSIGDLKNAFIEIGSSKILYGDFLSNLIDFLVIALVVYFGVKIIGVQNLDKKKG